MARPSKYKPAYVKQARKLAAAGATDREVADQLRIGVRTLYDWKLIHTAFARALQVGKAPADERVKRALFDRCVGFSYTEQQAIKVKDGPNQEKVVTVEVERFAPPDMTGISLWMRNRCDWRDKKDHEHSGHVTVTKVEREIVDPPHSDG